MQVGNRINRRYITPSMKNQPGNKRPTIKKDTDIPPISHSSPKKIADASVSKPEEPSTLKKLIDRFRYEEPQPRPERESVSSDFWWLNDESKSNCTEIDDADERKPNIPEFIEIFPSTDIDQDLNKRASLLLNQTFSAHSSDTCNVSSTGVGSTPSTTLTTTTTSTFHTIVHEKPARPLFTRNVDLNYNLAKDGSEDDILYQWRLRRRLEQARNDEPITFPNRIISRITGSPPRSQLPWMPIETHTALPPRPFSSQLAKTPSSPKRERQQSEPAHIEIDQIKQTNVSSVPIRQYSEMSTQTVQDACIQTSLKLENNLSSSAIVPNETDLQPTRDNDQHSSIWHRPPPRSKCEITRVSSSSLSPSPVKRHHHRHHHHSFRPVVVAEQPITNDNFHHQRSIINPSNTVQCSQDSTLTQVTSIMINDNQDKNQKSNPYAIKTNTSIATIDEFHEQHKDNDDDDDEFHEQHKDNDDDDDDDDDDHHVDYSNDEILNMLIKKRDELLVAFREIEQQLANI